MNITKEMTFAEAYKFILDRLQACNSVNIVWYSSIWNGASQSHTKGFEVVMYRDLDGEVSYIWPKDGTYMVGRSHKFCNAIWHADDVLTDISAGACNPVCPNCSHTLIVGIKE